MKPDLKKKWLKALRSGDYDQGTGALCEVTAEGAPYCCLGVLAEVKYGASRWKEQYPLMGAVTTTRLSMKLGFHVETVMYNDSSMGFAMGQPSTLASMNDSGKSFTEIADYIENNL